MSSSIQLDAQFGPQLPGSFDFTVLFEHAMFWLVPTGIVILVTPFYAINILRAQRQVRPGRLLWAKMACGLALVSIQATNIALWHNTDYFHSPVTITASIMSLIASICIMGIIAVTHIYCVQPSSFLSLFFSITLFFDATMARSYFRRDTLGVAIAALQVCVVILKAILIVLEELSKRGLYLATDLQSTVSPETAAGFWNRSLFVWLNPLLFFGWRDNFTLDNLPNIGDDFESQRLFDLFSPQWTKADKSSRFALLFALFHTLKWQFIQVLLPRLCYIGFVIGQPFLLLRTVQAVGGYPTSQSSSNGLIGACGIIYFGISVTKTLFEHWGYRVVTSVRGILIVAIYDKLQRLSVDALESGGAVTLMSTDVSGTEDIISLAYESWSCVIQIAFGIWVLHSFIGPACFLIIFPTLVTFLGSILTGKKVSKARAAWNSETEHRIAATSNMLAQLKSVKSMGLSSAFSKFIEEKRDAEIVASLQERYTRLWVYGFGAVNFTVTPAIVFAGAYFWTRVDDPMSVAEVFAILAVLAISSNPLIDFFTSVTLWSGAFASVTRIQAFLVQKENIDPRDLPDLPTEETKGSGGEKVVAPVVRKLFAFELSNVSVTSPTVGPVLREITFTIPWGSRAMMWGPMNCGKSTLLKALLGEVELNGGTISAGTRDIAYCSQDTWIENCSFQQAIIGALPLIQPFYNEVLVACALDADVQAMPNGDQTQTGSGGCNLSGGQKQRLGLARSAYAQKEIMVLDDMFSSVDPETAGIIFDRLLGPQGIVRRWNCTVVMTTNRLELLDFADQIFQFSRNGRLVEQNDNGSDDYSAAAESSDEGSNAEEATANQQQDDANAVEDEESDLPAVETKEEDDASQSKDDGSKGELSVYKYFLGSAGVLAIIGWVCLAMTAAAGEWMPVIFLRIWFVKNPQHQISFIGYGILSIGAVAFNVLNAAFYFTFIFPKTTNEMHRRLLTTVLGATPDFINETDSGTLLNRFSQDISLVTSKLALLVNQFVFLTFTTLVEIGMISAGSPYAVPIILFILMVLSIVRVFYLRSSRQLRRLELEASSSLFTRFTETSEGIHHIRSFGWQASFRRRLFIELDRSQKPTYLLYCIQRWLTLTMDLTSTVASLVLVSLSLRLPDSTSDAAVGLAMLSLIGFSSTATGYVQTWTAFETSLGAILRIMQFVRGTPQEQDTISGPPLPNNWPANGRIDFNAVSSTYATTDGSSLKALDDVTFTIQPAQKIGIMGRTGSGKSTLLSTILRMVDHTGSVSIDGRNTKHLPRELLRSRITSITQDGLRIKATLRFNMYPFDGVQPTDEMIIDALQQVDIWNHVQLNGGLDTQYSKIRFSTTQKQLMFLARGILHQSVTGNKIVMIDEVTSSLPLDIEDDVQDIIDHAFFGCTILLISHRIESFYSADYVLRFQSAQLFSVVAQDGSGGWAEVHDF